MSKKRKSCFQPDAETVSELQNLCVSFATLLQKTGVDAHEMRGDLGKILDVYIELKCLTSELTLKSDPHLNKLLEARDAGIA